MAQKTQPAEIQAKHKKATAVSIAPTEERSRFDEFVQAYWKPVAAIAAIASIVILFMVYRRGESETAGDASWDRLLSVWVASPAEDETPASERLASVEAELEGTEAGPWNLYLLAEALWNEEQFDEARAAIDRFRSTYPDHQLAKATYTIAGIASPQTMLDSMETSVISEKKWLDEHPGLLSLAELPEGSPRVQINTDKGAIVVGLYEKEAPKHVENFLKLCRQGFYNNTKFHRVAKDFMIQGGDPNTREEDTARWGLGGPGYKIEPEKNSLRHFEGVLAGAKQPEDVESSGCQFFITTDPAHHLDGVHVVFGKVIEGFDVVEAIEAGELVDLEKHRPAVPVEILSMQEL